MTYWAIKYLFQTGGSHLDHITISRQRKDAWAKFERDISCYPESTQKRFRRDRRAGMIRAVNVEIVEVEA